MKAKTLLWLGFVAVPLSFAMLSGVKSPSKSPAHATGVRYSALQAPAKPTGPTYTKDVAPILFDNCTSCHRPGEVAPFTFLTYDDAKKRARLIADVTGDRTMPPWQADEGIEKFHDARVLSEEQIQTLKKWAEAGAPEGDPKDLPPTPKFTQGWQLGEPDWIADPKEEYTLDAEGRDVYRCFVVKTDFPEDRYISTIEVRPGNRKVVHHLIAYLDTSGRARQMDEKEAGPGYTSFGGPGFTPSGTLGGWAPGNLMRPAGDGIGWLLPKGADIVLQVHYHKSGKVENDRTVMGLKFVQGPVEKRVRWLTVVNPLLRLPAGEKDQAVRAVAIVPADVTARAVMPHMHLLGKTAEITATLPNGTKQKLVNVDRWDFNWQQSYAFQKPLKLPKGTRIDLEVHYDNSAENPRNPSNPPRTVTWGEQTTDEMCLAFLLYTVDSENIKDGKAVGAQPGDFGGGGRRGGGGDDTAAIGGFLKQIVAQFDKDGDGKLNAEERQEAWKYWQQIAGGAANKEKN